MWTQNDQNELNQRLENLKNEKYQKFHTGLGVHRVLGVTIPNLEKVAKQLVREHRAIDYLNDYHSCHYEGDVLYGMLIGLEKMDFSQRETYIWHFCEMIDNWATCDCAIARWKFVKKEPNVCLQLIRELLATHREWHARVGYVMLLDYYLNDHFLTSVLDCLREEIPPFYYSQMAAAWLISIGLAKYPETFEPWLSSTKLSPMVYQKALQKAIESHRTPLEKKEKYRIMKKQLSVE